MDGRSVSKYREILYGYFRKREKENGKIEMQTQNLEGDTCVDTATTAAIL